MPPVVTMKRPVVEYAMIKTKRLNNFQKKRYNNIQKKDTIMLEKIFLSNLVLKIYIDN